MARYYVGIIGAPCAGKSLTTAEIYARCKLLGIKTGHVKEYIAELFNQGWNMESVADQLLIYHEQLHREENFPEETEVVITDSPVLLSYFYGLLNAKHTVHDEVILSKLYSLFLSNLDRYDLLVLLERAHEYENDGTRQQSECEANQIHTYLMHMLDMHGVKYEVVPSINAADTIIKTITENVLA